MKIVATDEEDTVLTIPVIARVVEVAIEPPVAVPPVANEHVAVRVRYCAQRHQCHDPPSRLLLVPD